MGIIRGKLSLIAGTVFGIYIAQNYNVPNINKLFIEAFLTAKQLEEKHRKRHKLDDNDAV